MSSYCSSHFQTPGQAKIRDTMAIVHPKLVQRWVEAEGKTSDESSPPVTADELNRRSIEGKQKNLRDNLLLNDHGSESVWLTVDGVVDTFGKITANATSSNNDTENNTFVEMKHESARKFERVGTFVTVGQGKTVRAKTLWSAIQEFPGEETPDTSSSSSPNHPQSKEMDVENTSDHGQRDVFVVHMNELVRIAIEVDTEKDLDERRKAVASAFIDATLKLLNLVSAHRNSIDAALLHVTVSLQAPAGTAGINFGLIGEYQLQQDIQTTKKMHKVSQSKHGATSTAINRFSVALMLSKFVTSELFASVLKQFGIELNVTDVDPCHLMDGLNRMRHALLHYSTDNHKLHAISGSVDAKLTFPNTSRFHLIPPSIREAAKTELVTERTQRCFRKLRLVFCPSDVFSAHVNCPPTLETTEAATMIQFCQAENTTAADMVKRFNAVRGKQKVINDKRWLEFVAKQCFRFGFDSSFRSSFCDGVGSHPLSSDSNLPASVLDNLSALHTDSELFLLPILEKGAQGAIAKLQFGLHCAVGWKHLPSVTELCTELATAADISSASTLSSSVSSSTQRRQLKLHVQRAHETSSSSSSMPSANDASSTYSSDSQLVVRNIHKGWFTHDRWDALKQDAMVRLLVSGHVSQHDRFATEVSKRVQKRKRGKRGVRKGMNTSLANTNDVYPDDGDDDDLLEGISEANQVTGRTPLNQEVVENQRKQQELKAKFLCVALDPILESTDLESLRKAPPNKSEKGGQQSRPHLNSAQFDHMTIYMGSVQETINPRLPLATQITISLELNHMRQLTQLLRIQCLHEVSNLLRCPDTRWDELISAGGKHNGFKAFLGDYAHDLPSSVVRNVLQEILDMVSNSLMNHIPTLASVFSPNLSVEAIEKSISRRLQTSLPSFRLDSKDDASDEELLDGESQLEWQVTIDNQVDTLLENHLGKQVGSGVKTYIRSIKPRLLFNIFSAGWDQYRHIFVSALPVYNQYCQGDFVCEWGSLFGQSVRFRSIVFSFLESQGWKGDRQDFQTVGSLNAELSRFIGTQQDSTTETLESFITTASKCAIEYFQKFDQFGVRYPEFGGPGDDQTPWAICLFFDLFRCSSEGKSRQFLEFYQISRLAGSFRVSGNQFGVHVFALKCNITPISDSLHKPNILSRQPKRRQLLLQLHVG
eukprot:TRINITY_DN3522_c0_g1_i47.p1 TRINITY_DN3522_c0_g1~~TRINITY_DN3522_c0_g1_i47.p1  ORF type:complete len:1163 (-),score=208.96 TRINITY_DN3522_c0_g1_i47:1049-4537(-)